MMKLEKKYDPGKAEKRWYQYWIEKKLFHAEENSSKKPFTIVIPPPNVTGSLHMGHALNSVLQDILIRWKKMDGFNVLWQPGTDHAGIATQNVVERQLLQEGTKRDELGRDKFIERVWKWKEESGSTITRQLMKLGSSCDWERERFTMDEGLSAAVREVFVSLYKEGLIYRKNYIINHCPRCNTALSDLEVEHQEMKGHLYYIRYPFSKGNGSLTIATTRPETMLGDTAVAVNPKDSRYKKKVGDNLLLPIMDREIPLIAESYVDMEFGTGALKITPAHDPNDFEIGIKNSLPLIKVLNNDGTMNEEAGKYQGMDRFECRKKLLEDLEEKNFLLKTEDYLHSVGHCYRCKTILEPTVSLQWFVKIKPLAEPAIQAVKEGKIKIIPKNWEKTYFEWMENIKDWCISRQIWWGHQIPAWHCAACAHINVEKNRPEKCDKCGKNDLVQETDVLDTWFSSALWPFSTLGWPEKTKTLEVFYPTSVMVTGFDILFFWVARMIMMGLKFMDNVPFEHVYIHALVRDAEGKKMSKSKGNIVDPLQIMDKYGTDAFRFALSAFAAHGRDIKLSEERIEGYRHFANKLWNASRFTLMNLSNQGLQPDDRKLFEAKDKFVVPHKCGTTNRETTFSDSLNKRDKASFLKHQKENCRLPDRWILSRLNSTISATRKSLDEYRFNDASEAIYRFIWHELCDWYIEIIKPRLYEKEEGSESARQTLLSALGSSLRLLHPFMPFITEEIWDVFNAFDKKSLKSGSHEQAESILLAPYPKFNEDLVDSEAEMDMKAPIDVVNAVRSVRGEINISPARKIKILLKTENPKKKQIILDEVKWITRLAGLETLEFCNFGEKPENAAVMVLEDVELFVLLGDFVNLQQEKTRIEKEVKKMQEELDFLGKKLSNSDFVNKAPQVVVNKSKKREIELKAKIAKVLAFFTAVETE